jgi:hypothetical protein
MNKPRVFAADILRILDALPESEQIAACRAAGFEPIETAADAALNKLDPQQRPPDGAMRSSPNSHQTPPPASARSSGASPRICPFRRRPGSSSPRLADQRAGQL